MERFNVEDDGDDIELEPKTRAEVGGLERGIKHGQQVKCEMIDAT